MSAAEPERPRFSKLGEQLEQLLPAALSEEIRTQIEQLVASHLAEMGVVTREQFDIQRRVLEKTRRKLADIEATLEQLEKNLK